MPTEMETFWQDHILSRNYLIFPAITFEYSFISEGQFQIMIYSLLNYHWKKVFMWNHGVIIHKPNLLVRIESPGFTLICLSVLYSKNIKKKKVIKEILLSIQSIGLKWEKGLYVESWCYNT